jgi:hypothetical protein
VKTNLIHIVNRTYTGPAVRIHTTVKWQDPSGTKCTHGGIGSSNPVPRTTSVSDSLLLQNSSSNMTHTSSGRRKTIRCSPTTSLNTGTDITSPVPPRHDPVPVGALCPQFYEYYTPDDSTDGTSRPDYLSAILLLEHCSSEIAPAELDENERQESASLLFRFHHAVWLHKSFAERNLLWQLIDFCRSRMDGRGRRNSTVAPLMR